MSSLRELGAFVGIPEDSPEWGYSPDVGLRVIDQLLAPVTPAAERGSLRALLARAQSLAPVTLDARLFSPTGREPHTAVVRLAPATGLVISTRIHYSQGGQVFAVSDNYRAADGDLSSTPLARGSWDIVVRRAGIGTGGYVRLSSPSFRATVTAPPSPPPPPPPPPTRPTIAVTQSGPASAVTYLVRGSGFLPGQPSGPQGISVRFVDGVDVQDWVMLYTGSDGSGMIQLDTRPLDTTVLGRNAAGQAIVHVSATDTRRDPGSVPANEPLWSNTVTFRY